MQCGGADLVCGGRVRRAAFAFMVTCPPKGSEPSRAESTGCGAGWTNHTLALPDSRRTPKLGASKMEKGSGVTPPVGVTGVQSQQWLLEAG